MTTATTTLTDFGPSDWNGWGGAEGFEATGNEPQIAEVLVDYDGWVEQHEIQDDQGPDLGGLPAPDEHGNIPLTLICDNGGVSVSDDIGNALLCPLDGESTTKLLGRTLTDIGTLTTAALVGEWGLTAGG